MNVKHWLKLVSVLLTTLWVFGATAQAGELTGVVKFKGKPRVAKPIQIVGDDSCAAAHQAGLLDEKFVYGETADSGVVTLANVFVRVRKGLPEKQFEVPKEPAVLDQKNCVFVPRVQGIRAGQTLQIRNSDTTAHNVHALPKRNKQFNNGQPPETRPLEKIFEREEVMVEIKCDIHKWMGCYIGVVSHPFFAVTGKDGTFSLKGLPDGEYEVEAWHELLKTQSQTVTVKSGAAANVEFVFSKPGGE